MTTEKANEIARKIVGDYVVSIIGFPSSGAYDQMKGGELVKAIEKPLGEALSENEGLKREVCGLTEKSGVLTGWLGSQEKELDQTLRAMNDLHSLLSLIRHRHLPRGLDLEKDIDTALAVSEKLLRPWWEEEMKKRKNPECECGRPAAEHGGCRNYRPKTQEKMA